MVSDEDWRKAPDWDKITELKHPCDCPSSCERKVVGCGYDGSKAYWCRNCGCVYWVKELRPVRITRQFGSDKIHIKV